MALLAFSLNKFWVVGNFLCITLYSKSFLVGLEELLEVSGVLATTPIEARKYFELLESEGAVIIDMVQAHCLL